MEQYRGYLDEKYVDDFEAWRGRYKNPFRDLQGEQPQPQLGRRPVARPTSRPTAPVAEIVFPNTVPPFFPTGALVARPPSRRRPRAAGGPDCARTTAGSPTGAPTQPDRRAGIAQVFAQRHRRRDRRGAVGAASTDCAAACSSPASPDDTDILPLLPTRSTTALWRVCEELEMPVNHHSGSGHPDYGDAPAAGIMWLIETGWFAHRAFWQVMMSGVFERFPNLKFVLTESGCAWLVDTLRMLDGFHMQMATGRIGELKFDADNRLPRPPSEYFKQNCFVGVSFPGVAEAKGMKKLGLENMMWGSDYPHHEGSTPVLARAAAHGLLRVVGPADLQQVLARTAAKVYGFDVDKLAPIAAKVGPTVAELAYRSRRDPEGRTSPGFWRWSKLTLRGTAKVRCGQIAVPLTAKSSRRARS